MSLDGRLFRFCVVPLLLVMACFGCTEPDYRAPGAFKGAAQSDGVPAAEEITTTTTRPSTLHTGPCTEMLYDLPDETLSTFYTYTYDDRGYLVRLRYGSILDGDISSWDYEYDDGGVLRATTYNPNGRLEFVYNAQGFQEAELWNADDDAALESLTVALYENNRLVARETLNENGVLVQRIEFDYNEAEQKAIEVFRRSPSGQATFRTERTYSDLSLNPVPWTSDARPGLRGCSRRFCYGPSVGQLLREDWHESDTGELTRSFVMAYDDVGNLTTITSVLPDGVPVTRVEFGYGCWGE